LVGLFRRVRANIGLGGWLKASGMYLVFGQDL
jgi:hypothetical protein